MITGDLRSVVQAKDAERLKILRIETDDPATTLNYLFHRGYEWLVPACEWSCDWMFRRNKPSSECLYAIDEEDWRLSVGGLLLADASTFDIQKAQHEWSIVPAWLSLPAWWAWADDVLARGEISQDLYDAPMNAILAKWRWCRGEVSNGELAKASSAARSAVCSARSATRSATRSAAASAAYSAAYWAGHSAADSADSAAASAAASACSAAYSAAYSAADSAAYSAARSEFDRLFTEYILYCLANDLHAVQPA